MRLLAAILGLVLLFATLWDAFETIILPRRVTRAYRIVRVFYQFTWKIWSGIGRTVSLEKIARDAPELLRAALAADAVRRVGRAADVHLRVAAMVGGIGNYAIRARRRRSAPICT